MSALASTLNQTRLGVPVLRRNLTIVPLYRDDSNGRNAPDYLPLGDAIQSGKAKVTEVSQSGSVPTLVVQNDADVALFILDGEELIGAKQNRVVNLSILVPAKTRLPIPVSCVERGRWSYRTREFHSSPHTLFSAGRAQQQMAVSASMLSRGTREANQHQVWETVALHSMALGAASPTEAMHDVYEAKRASIDDYLAGLDPDDGQVGAVFAVGGRVVGAELFESPELFASYYMKVVRGYALDALVEEGREAVVPEGADSLLADLRSAKSSRFRAIGLGEDLRIEDDGLTGGALLLDDRVVHLAAFRRRASIRD